MKLGSLIACLVSWAILTPCSRGGALLAQGTDARGYEELTANLAKELSAAGFEVDLDQLTIEVREPDACLESLGRVVDRSVLAMEYQSMRALHAALGRDLGENEQEARDKLARALTQALVAFYEPEEKALVFISNLWLESADRERLILHELVHAWRDQQSGLAKLLDPTGKTLDAMYVDTCLSEGEAEVVATTILLARSGVSLDIAENLILVPPRLGVGMSLPYEFGARYQGELMRTGGRAAVDATWNLRPPTTEQLMHSEKLDADTPTTVTLPPWPEDAGEAELAYETTVGELGILGLLLDSFADAVDARQAAIGWDGDLLRVYHSSKGATIVFRSVWDREEDARQFAAIWKRQSKGKVTQAGRVVDWVHSDSPRDRRKLLTMLEGNPLNLEPSPDDARTTTAIEASLDYGDRPHVRDGEWVLPELGLRMPAPEGWVVRDVGGLTGLFAPPIGGSSDCLGIQLLEPEGFDTLEEFRQAVVSGMERPGTLIEETSLVRIDGVDAVYYRARNTAGLVHKTQATIRLQRDETVILVIAVVATSRWNNLEEQIETTLGGIRFDVREGLEPSDSSATVAEEGPLRRIHRASRFEPLRLPVTRHAIEDDGYPGRDRPVINIHPDGRIVGIHRWLLELPAAPRLTEEAAKEIRFWFYGVASQMKERVPTDDGLPSEELLIRADATTPFYFFQKLMENCAYQGIQLWKLTFAVASEADDVWFDSRLSRGPEGLLRVYLPRDMDPGAQRVDIEIEVKNAGTKINPDTGEAWSGEPGTSFVYDSDRRLEYTLAGRSTTIIEHVSRFLKRFEDAEGEWGVRIDARTDVTFEEVVRIIEAALDAGLTEITFIGTYD